MRALTIATIAVVSASVAFGDDKPEELLRRALYFGDLYNWRAARPDFTRAAELFEAAGDKRNALYARLGAIRAGANPAPIPVVSYQLEHELATNPILQSDKELRMFCLIVKGDFDGEIDTPAMRRDWSEVAALARELGNAKWQYRAQGQLGFADFYDGDLPGAQRKVAEALIGATTAKDIGAQIFYLSTTANGLQSQGMNDQAIQYADRAIAIAEANPDTGYPVIAQQARLSAMVRAGRLDPAETALRAILARPEVQASSGQMAVLRSTASRIARARNNLQEAIDSLEQALRDAQTVAHSREIPEYQSELSDLYRLTGNLSKAEELARSAAASAQSGGFIPLIPQLLHVLAQVQISQQKYDEADHTYARAAAIQDMMIGNADSALGKTALVKGASDLYAKHFALVAEHIDDAAKAFGVVEQVRGRVMTDLLLSGMQTSPQSLAAEKEIARLRLKLMAAHSDREIRELRDAIFLAEQSRSITPEISILKAKEHQAVTLAQLQKSLAPSEAVLEYVVDDPASYCLVITLDRARIAKLPGKQAILPLVTAYLAEVQAKRPARDEARRLFDVLVNPITEAKSKEQLIIVRDGQLHLVPFDALLDGHNRYLVESRTVVYSPSATSFFLLRATTQPKRAARALLAVGGVPYDGSGLKRSAVTRGYSATGLFDLPSSEDEARAAAAALPNRTNTLLLGKNATESAFKKAINHQIIHVAVHAIANETRPDRAALVMLSDPSAGEDGFLQASEVVQLPLNADLVVLSACDTAVGPLEGQEGISTLSRAFLLAGARTVVSTLWSVDDDTTLYLMKKFYAELARHKRAPDALTAAKKAMLQAFGPTKALPYYWAGFTVEGFARAPLKH